MLSQFIITKQNQAQGQVDTLIPILFYRYKDAQLAIDAAIVLLETAVANFEQAANALLTNHTQDDEVATKLGNFIDGCRYACTANLNWR